LDTIIQAIGGNPRPWLAAALSFVTAATYVIIASPVTPEGH
jgi:hypothetical protein